MAAFHDQSQAETYPSRVGAKRDVDLFSWPSTTIGAVVIILNVKPTKLWELELKNSPRVKMAPNKINKGAGHSPFSEHISMA